MHTPYSAAHNCSLYVHVCTHWSGITHILGSEDAVTKLDLIPETQSQPGRSSPYEREKCVCVCVWGGGGGGYSK